MIACACVCCDCCVTACALGPDVSVCIMFSVGDSQALWLGGVMVVEGNQPDGGKEGAVLFLRISKTITCIGQKPFLQARKLKKR